MGYRLGASPIPWLEQVEVGRTDPVVTSDEWVVWVKPLYRPIVLKKRHHSWLWIAPETHADRENVNVAQCTSTLTAPLRLIAPYHGKSH